ncbi:MAG: adenosylcobinamide amidohydrolase [Phocaeicola sp.]|nr:adenosylcobinamide amidohydrolase [Phocaeicola sp.]
MGQLTNPFDRSNVLFSTPMGDKAYFANESLIVEFEGKRGVVSTSNLNGGYRNDLRYVYNHSVGKMLEIQERRCPGIKGANLREHYTHVTEEIGLPPALSTGMGTAALIENLACAEQERHGVRVMAVATAGVDVNGGRAGDKASYDEFERKSLLVPAGTINIFLFINAKLDAGVLTRAIVTATEAKTAALWDLMASSRYSEGLATGSGTDSVIAICNEESEVELFNAGKHVLLGEMIGLSVKEAVSKALDKQTGMNPQRQASFLWQGSRYGLSSDKIIQYYKHIYGSSQTDETLHKHIETLSTDSYLCAEIASLLHLIDQHRGALIDEQTLIAFAQRSLKQIAEHYHLDANEYIDLRRARVHAPSAGTPFYKCILSDLILQLAHVIAHSSL